MFLVLNNKIFLLKKLHNCAILCNFFFNEFGGFIASPNLNTKFDFIRSRNFEFECPWFNPIKTKSFFITYLQMHKNNILLLILIDDLDILVMYWDWHINAIWKWRLKTLQIFYFLIIILYNRNKIICFHPRLFFAFDLI